MTQLMADEDIHTMMNIESYTSVRLTSVKTGVLSATTYLTTSAFSSGTLHYNTIYSATLVKSHFDLCT